MRRLEGTPRPPARQVLHATSLYRRVLGDGFARLPGALRDFHGRPDGGLAVGTGRVTRGRGWLRRRLADLLGLPPERTRAAVRLEVRVERDRERWRRHFDHTCLETVLWWDRGLLVEAVGPMRFGFRVTATGDGMRFLLVRRWLFGLPWPALLGPRVDALIVGLSTGWVFDVRVAVPLLGDLIRYEGEVSPV